MNLSGIFERQDENDWRAEEHIKVAKVAVKKVIVLNAGKIKPRGINLTSNKTYS